MPAVRGDHIGHSGRDMEAKEELHVPALLRTYLESSYKQPVAELEMYLVLVTAPSHVIKKKEVRYEDLVDVVRRVGLETSLLGRPVTDRQALQEAIRRLEGTSWNTPGFLDRQTTLLVRNLSKAHKQTIGRAIVREIKISGIALQYTTVAKAWFDTGKVEMMLTKDDSEYENFQALAQELIDDYNWCHEHLPLARVRQAVIRLLTRTKGVEYVRRGVYCAPTSAAKRLEAVSEVSDFCGLRMLVVPLRQSVLG